MPRLACWFIRAALLQLAVGALLGALILSGKGLPLALGWAWTLLAAHVQIMVGGWMLQLTLGMAYWILPRVDAGGSRGRTALAWASFGSINAGVLLAAAALTARGFYPGSLVDGLLVLAALLQPAGLAAFATHAWPRLAPLTLPPLGKAAPEGERQ